MNETAAALFKEIAPAHRAPHSKVTVVGVGQVGMACAVSIMQKVTILLFYSDFILIRFHGLKHVQFLFCIKCVCFTA